MLCLMARPQIHLPNVKTCLDVVNTYVIFGDSCKSLFKKWELDWTEGSGNHVCGEREIQKMR